MRIDEIRELVTLLEDSKLNVLEITEGDSRIRLEKSATGTVAARPQQSAAGSLGNPLVPAQGPSPASTPDSGRSPAVFAGLREPQEVAAPAPAGKAVKSPMVGVFYGKPAPDEKPFVTVGSRVENGDVLCIIEAMKLMNEITADLAGEITEVCVSDGDIVEFGQPLFYLA